MRKFILSAILSLGLAATAHAGIVTSDSASFSETSGVSANVRAECGLESKLPQFIAEFADKQGVALELKSGKLSTKKGKVLVVEISNVSGLAGGAWSGAKGVSVKGVLYDNGKQIADFVATRHSGGGAFAGFKGSCSILGRCVKALASDIAEWLKHPSKKARLGEA